MRVLVAIGTALVLVAAPSAGFAALCDAMARGAPCAAAPAASSPCGPCHRPQGESSTGDACAHCWLTGASAAQELTPAASVPAPPSLAAGAASAETRALADADPTAARRRHDQGPPPTRPLTVLLCTYRT